MDIRGLHDGTLLGSGQLRGTVNMRLLRKISSCRSHPSRGLMRGDAHSHTHPHPLKVHWLVETPETCCDIRRLFTSFTHSLTQTDVFSLQFISLHRDTESLSLCSFLSCVTKAPHLACGFVSLANLDCLL